MSRTVIVRWAIGAVGILLLGLASASLFALAFYEEGTELPLRNASGLAVDSRGQVYCALVRDGVVQVYGGEGTFLRSFKVPGNPSWFEIRIDDQGSLEVADIGAHRLHVLSDSGEVLESVPASESGGRYEEFAFDVRKSASDASGATLRIDKGKLVRELPDGRIEVLVTGSQRIAYRIRELVPLLYPMSVALLVIAFLGVERTTSVVRRLASVRYPGFRSP